MQLRNSSTRFGLVAKGFHWLVALLFATQIGIGVAITNLALTHPWTFPLYQWHKSLGALVFVLVVLRLGWRWLDRAPDLPDTLPRWQRRAATLTHAGLYAVLLVMPLLGWIIVSASPYGIPTVLFDLVELPHIAFIVTSPHRDAIGAAASWAHWALAWGASGLLLLHIGAALAHHFAMKDDILLRMLPTRGDFTSRPIR
tara:strand:+ start:6568 stop:7164 length:597 start_codon:yes stop_codon:yes gene_type:complete